ncbi:MAG: NAD-dependent epimerase/dehydratase family protein [Rhodospirillales bacterium]|nr:NAD-dependent epimerase/dehydratase family protein [Rhodospirillales bacterium]
MLEHRFPDSRPPQRVVILGAGGFVGGAILARLRAEGIAAEPVSHAALDLTAEDAATALRGLLRAGDSLAFVSARAPARTPALLTLNVRMAETVCAAVAGAGLDHLLYISSDAVYADDAALVSERIPAAPGSPHGVMHLARELMLKSAGVPMAILRPSLLYGSRDPHNGYGPNRFLRQAGAGQSITLFGEGEEQRDHVAVEDLAELALRALKHGSVGVLNVATGRSASFREVAERAAAGRVPVSGSPRQSPVTHRHFDVTARLAAFPDLAMIPLAEGMERMRLALAKA